MRGGDTKRDDSKWDQVLRVGACKQTKRGDSEWDPVWKVGHVNRPKGVTLNDHLCQHAN